MSGSKTDSLYTYRFYIHVNIRSVPRNLSAFENFLQLLNYDFKVIGLSETWFNENNHDLFCMSGYTITSNYRTKKVGGVNSNQK